MMRRTHDSHVKRHDPPLELSGSMEAAAVAAAGAAAEAAPALLRQVQDLRRYLKARGGQIALKPINCHTLLETVMT